MKRISRFNPAAHLGRTSSERHYLEVHHPFVRRLFREHGKLVVRYVANLAIAQYDLNGQFREQPSAWRFVILETTGPVTNATAFIPPAFQELIWQDHQKCLQELTAAEVREHVIVDRRAGQTSSAKYLFWYQVQGPDVASENELKRRARYYSETHVPRLGSLFEQAYGARLFLSNEVCREAATMNDHGPGSSYSGEYLRHSNLLAVDEFYFDNQEWGDEFFAAREVVESFRDAMFGRVEGYRVTEMIGVDKR